MATPNPDQIVLDALFADFVATEYPGTNVDDAFEIYAATQVLKPRELSVEELAAGIVDGTKDGGIDSFFVFLNGILVSPDDAFLIKGDPSVALIGPYPLLEVFLIQSKNSTSWQESVWEHLLSSLSNLLDVGASDEDLETIYRADVVERTGILRKAVVSLGAKFPKVAFRTVYVSRAPEANITETVQARAAQVAALVTSKLTSGATVTSDHIGVSALYTLAGTDYTQPGVLKFRSLIRETDSFVGIVALSDYLAFVRSDAGVLREELFDSNVRDFEGDNIVNKAIAETLAKNDTSEFWWLNNGVTVLGDKVDSPQQTLTISRPLIVNGLQTSHVLHYAEHNSLFAPERLNNGLLVRVIVTSDEDVRDQIIAGTNRQTHVPTPALYATQPLQRDIERFLVVHDWYYERRKNRYRNLGKPAKRRITINLLAQSMITLMLGQPDVARARPSTLLSKKDGYEQVFPSSLDMAAYLTAVETIKAVDDFLTTDVAKDVLDEFSNSRFYVAAGYLILAMKLKDTSDFHFDKNFSKLKAPLKQPLLVEALTVLTAAAAAFATLNPKSSRDTIFKSSEFREAYFRALTA
ncbi:AIPR family protein [Cryobacterium sp. HLT2-28]|uniref:AIPR family protein n=1 Tax=Cryobacterium sp. HLT2-28 TaxID=1259146 RepID=UPI00141ADB97|nr:AIPR family protein [Cryobacterium sp. HLT2-28]